ncbi:MAG: NADH-quinone oxidoreductase subunit A, partial [Acidimicrobiaceae bacterium]
MSTFLRSYLTVVWFGAAAVAIAGLLLWIASIVRPNRPNREKMLTYESGVDPVGHGWSQSQVRRSTSFRDSDDLVARSTRSITTNQQSQPPPHQT